MIKARELLIYLAVKYEGNWKKIYECISKKTNECEENDVKEAVNSLKCNAVTIMDPEYPSHLKHINMPPFVLFYHGDLSILYDQDKSIAFVGSRKYGAYGKEMTEKLVRELSNDYVIVSGMALGIDGIAHWAAISSNKKTVAVLGSGINYCHPKTNFDLYNKIKENHLIISEYPDMTMPKPEHFPTRNRIIAGLAKAVVVTVGKIQSGTHITVCHALELGKSIMAVPYKAGEESLGNFLIKQGACMIESVDDIYNELGSSF